MKAKGKRQKAKGKGQGEVGWRQARALWMSWHPAVRLRLFAFYLLPFTFCLLLGIPVRAQYGSPPRSMERQGTPEILEKVGIEQRLNEQVPLDLVFRDETGRSVQLGEYFGSKPVILALVYYECPMLCNQVLNGLVGSLQALSFNAGKEFNIVTVSFDARETPALAAAKKETYLKRYGRKGAADGWHFLTGEQASIDALTKAVGFKYAYDPQINQFAHASGIMVLTPQGKLARYLYGIEYAPRDLRLGLIEASQNKIGSPVDQLILYCYHYDPTTGKYGPIIMNFMRLGGILTVLGLVALILILRRRNASPDGVRVGGTA